MPQGRLLVLNQRNRPSRIALMAGVVFIHISCVQVRELRQKLDRLKNDLSNVNKDMEAALHRAHAAARGNSAPPL